MLFDLLPRLLVVSAIIHHIYLSFLLVYNIIIRNESVQIIRGFKKLHNWKLKSCGAYFAYIEHPFSECASVICKKLLSNQAILSLPETMFTPKSTESIKKHIRIAFANINKSEINELFKRLKDFKY